MSGALFEAGALLKAKAAEAIKHTAKKTNILFTNSASYF
jgi:hypothetical protein